MSVMLHQSILNHMGTYWDASYGAHVTWILQGYTTVSLVPFKYLQSTFPQIIGNIHTTILLLLSFYIWHYFTAYILWVFLPSILRQCNIYIASTSTSVLQLSYVIYHMGDSTIYPKLLFILKMSWVNSNSIKKRT